MRHRLILVEGPPCSGKSTVSARIAAALAEEARVRFVDEGTPVLYAGLGQPDARTEALTGRKAMAVLL